MSAEIPHFTIGGQHQLMASPLGTKSKDRPKGTPEACGTGVNDSLLRTDKDSEDTAIFPVERDNVSRWFPRLVWFMSHIKIAQLHEVQTLGIHPGFAMDDLASAKKTE